MDAVEQINARLDRTEAALGAAIGQVRQKVETLQASFSDHAAREEAQNESHVAFLEDIKAWTFGDEKNATNAPGAKTRLDRLEQWRNRISWGLTSVVVPVVLYVVYLVLQWQFAPLLHPTP